jgi:crotonobetaine/carnitine-CoA ligase
LSGSSPKCRSPIRKVALREAGKTPDTWDRDAAGYKLRR